MKIISQQKSWFASPEGQKHFAEISDKSNQIGFMYSYLLAICKENNAKYDQNILFKYAFFLTDAVLTAEMSYSSLPDFLDCEKNPYLAFVENSQDLVDLTEPINIYTYLLLITHGVVDPFLKSEWIYDGNTIIGCAEKIAEMKHNILPTQLPDVNMDLFNVAKEKEFIQLEIIWIFGKSFI